MAKSRELRLAEDKLRRLEKKDKKQLTQLHLENTAADAKILSMIRDGIKVVCREIGVRPASICLVSRYSAIMYLKTMPGFPEIAMVVDDTIPESNEGDGTYSAQVFIVPNITATGRVPRKWKQYMERHPEGLPLESESVALNA